MANTKDKAEDHKKPSISWIDLEPSYYDGVASKELLVFDRGDMAPIGFFRFKSEDN